MDPDVLAMRSVATSSAGLGLRRSALLLWSGVDLEAGVVAISAQAMRVAGVGLVRGPTKSAAGQRILSLPGWCVEMLAARYARGIRPAEPVFCNVIGGFRDPSNVRVDLRRARAPEGAWHVRTSALRWPRLDGRPGALARR